MGYLVLARKWRPQRFDDLLGQGHVVQTLRNAIAGGRVAHAYLFAGARGVGKTTTARILAKALNCAQGPTPTPCDACVSCQEILSGTSLDVQEIDGASNRGIDHIRELREAIKFAPARGRYRIYIIDEVHMLTAEAFGALLKTLEEPPPHAVFVFATTDPQKVPPTILSRCQHFSFRRLTVREIVDRLRAIAAAEGIDLAEAPAYELARAADGSMRDALSLLDQVVAYGGPAVRVEDLRSLLGLQDTAALERMTEVLLGRDPSAALGIVQEVVEEGRDLRQFCRALLEHVRRLLLARVVERPEEILDLPDEEVRRYRQRVERVPPWELHALCEQLLRAEEELRWSPHQRLSLEIALVRATQVPPLASLQEVLEGVRRMGGASPSSPAETEHRVMPPAGPAPRGAGRSRQGREPAPPGGPAPGPVAQEATLSPAESGPIAPTAIGESLIPQQWVEIVRQVKREKPSLGAFLEQGALLGMAKGTWTVGVPEIHVASVNRSEHRAILERAIQERLGRAIAVKIVSLEGNGEGQKTAREYEEENRAQRRRLLAQEAREDPLVQQALRLFEGEVVEVRPPEDPRNPSPGQNAER
ncbi:MAG: DNA polymerase III subunit gamma/tau [Nitrospirae bacterium]|nr:DNA polymerase III subunit gamma/tau [Nitrospirota bacterium]